MGEGSIEKKVLAIENDSLKIETRSSKRNIELASEVQELKHDRNYLDIIMRSRSLMTVSQIAQDYGMSAKAFNQQLAQMGIQYKNNDSGFSIHDIRIADMYRAAR